jgi:hypothetical protein
MDRNEEFDRASLASAGEGAATDAPASVDVEIRNEPGKVPAADAPASDDVEGRNEPGAPVEAIVPMARQAGTYIDSPSTDLSLAMRSEDSTGAASARDVAPQDFLLLTQVAASAPNPHNERMQNELMDNAVDLYRSLQPQDPIESIIDRVLVAVTNSTMDCFARAAQCNESPAARHLNLRDGMKGARVVTDMVKHRDMRRGQTRQAVTVGNVSVQAGGQAIVGNVGIGEPSKKKAAAIPSPMKRDDEK